MELLYSSSFFSYYFNFVLIFAIIIYRIEGSNMNNKEPVVLGELKKEKSSKPIFVILCFALLLGTCFGLPYIKNYLNTEDNSFTRFYRSIFGSLTEDTGTDATTTTTTKTLEQTDLTILLSSSTINY